MPGLRERLLSVPISNPQMSPDHYQSVLDSVGSVVYTVDRNLRIINVNQQWDAFAQNNQGRHLTSEYILGVHLLDQMSGAALERWQTICRQLLDGSLPRYLDEIACQETFAWKHYSLNATPLKDKRGQIQGITFVATNITQLKKAETEMFRRLVEIRGLGQIAHAASASTDKRRFYKQVTSDIAHLFSAAKCAIFLWDEQTGHLQAQKPAFGIAGRKLSELWLDMGNPSDPDALWLDLEEKDYILLNEHGNSQADDHTGQLAAVMAVLRVSGRVHGAILIAGRDRPFSERDAQLLSAFAVPVALSIENAEINERLLNRIQLLATTRAELERIVSITEALRTPLRVVQGYFELLLDGALGPLSPEHIATMNLMHNKVQTLTHLVNRLAPLHVPSQAPRHELINLADLVTRATYGHLLEIKQADIELKIELPAPYNRANLTIGDPGLLCQALETLVDQTIQVSRPGNAITVSLHTAASNEIIYIKIHNPDAQLPTDRLTNLWEDTEHTENAALSRVKRIAERHGGQVWAKSEPGVAFFLALRKAPLPSAEP